ncbi:hypothetical protein FA95DRAFT_1267312 [Auriscalpium vulgare]|uniref:Uncharacterized protein n=1 Tax=Auriscalpium vulgare TaxID=40419 RepID=A0ACB8RTX4_9AGAM|nr:hypothetical protein FA95DRAFT_1267312 [Auriscalpium vulgare]
MLIGSDCHLRAVWDISRLPSTRGSLYIPCRCALQPLCSFLVLEASFYASLRLRDRQPCRSTPQPLGAPGSGQIAPGTITYTTSTSPDGRVTYHPFKAVPVSYQTASGVVSGIQWIPAEATSVLPTGAQPANADFAASWSRGNQNKDERALKEWQKDEERRLRKEEKEATKRIEKERRRLDREKEDRRAREEARRMSGNYAPSVAGSTGSGYGPATGPYSPYSNPVADIERRMDNVEIGRRDYERQRKPSVGYDNRRRSAYGEGGYPAAGAGARPPSPYNPPGTFPPSPIPGTGSLAYSGAAGPYANPTDPYQRAASPYHGAGTVPGVYPAEQAILSRSRAPSPNPGGMPYGPPRSRAASPIPGAIPYGARSRAASPIPGAMPYGPPRSRAASPMPGAGPGFPQATVLGRAPPSPHIGGGALAYAAEQQQMLPPPDGFSRPPNLAQSYTWFETMKIQDMDAFYENMPRMPLVLVPHDVYHEDWIRFMQDLALAWAGKLPTADPTRAAKRSNMTADLIELWNNSFFQQRGVEVVLFKGRERRSGPQTGSIEHRLPAYDESDDDSSSSSPSSSESDSSGDDKHGRAGPYGPYGRPTDPYAAADAKRRKAEKKAEKKRRRKEKKAKRKARERERTYAIYVTCIAPREGGLGPQY